MTDFERLVRIGEGLPEHVSFMFEYSRDEKNGIQAYSGMRSSPTSEADLPFGLTFDYTPQSSSSLVSIYSSREKSVPWNTASATYQAKDGQVECTFEQPSGTEPQYWRIPMRADHIPPDNERIPTDTYKYNRPVTRRTVVAMARLAAYYARKNQRSIDQSCRIAL